jgi:DNA-binding response OmpR family regulator
VSTARRIYKGSMAVKVLVVDDFTPFRQVICSVLRERELEICEASDGLEAVQKAEELKPDLILLDIGLPRLNGIEAARQIRKLSSSSKIIFLSQEPSPDIIQEALSTGACEYILKTRAAKELRAALDHHLGEASSQEHGVKPPQPPQPAPTQASER